MSIETDLYTTLANDAGVSALVSTRIYPNLVPESAANPCIDYSTITETRMDTLSGVGDARRSTIQISCHADTYAAAKGLFEAVYSALEGDGYLESAIDSYDPSTQTHSVYVTWRFMTTS